MRLSTSRTASCARPVSRTSSPRPACASGGEVHQQLHSIVAEPRAASTASTRGGVVRVDPPSAPGRPAQQCGAQGGGARVRRGARHAVQYLPGLGALQEESQVGDGGGDRADDEDVRADGRTHPAGVDRAGGAAPDQADVLRAALGCAALSRQRVREGAALRARGGGAPGPYTTGRSTRCVSREMFISHALVNGETVTRAPFFEHNQQLLRDVQELEAKSRRRNLMGPPEKRQAFFDKRLPPGGLLRRPAGALAQAGRAGEPEGLVHVDERRARRRCALDRVQGPLPGHDRSRRSQERQLGAPRRGAQYHLEPGHINDGVTALVPLEAMNRVDPIRAEWLVPGMLPGEADRPHRALPKSLRTAFIPAPQFADRAAEILEPRLKETDGVYPPLLRRSRERSAASPCWTCPSNHGARRCWSRTWR